MSSEGDDLPIYRALESPGDVPGFLERSLTHLRGHADDEELTFEAVDFEKVEGIWLCGLSVYDPDMDAAGKPWGVAMLAWETEAREAMSRLWGRPMIHSPRLVGDAREPEGILDHVLINLGYDHAEMWDRHDVFLALLTKWDGEPGVGSLQQLVMVVPRRLVMEGNSALIDDTTDDLLMHGEHPTELHRRAWLMSTVFGDGEARLHEAPLDGTRCSLQAHDGTTTVWIFADDGRVLLLINDPACTFNRLVARAAGDDPDAADTRRDEKLILLERLLDGVPDDLLGAVASPAVTVRGEIAGHDLEFGLLDDRPVPIITGAFWFDGTSWNVPRGLTVAGRRNGLGTDDFGFAAAVRRPYRLGGSFTPDAFGSSDDVERRALLDEFFAACPFPEQPRPEGPVRLGDGILIDADPAAVTEDVERVTRAWWYRDPDGQALDDETFTIGGRRLRHDGSGVMHEPLLLADPWTDDVFQSWVDDLVDAMTDRWGPPLGLSAFERTSGQERHTPLTRLMRGMGLEQGPLWWVNGHAVLLLAGTMPDPSHILRPQAILEIGRADTLIELLGRTSIWETRMRLRAIAECGSVTWDGPALPGSDIVPDARRAVLRTDGFTWEGYFTHDGRGMLITYRADGTTAPDPDLDDLFDGVPEDLMTLLDGPDPTGDAPIAVFCHDGLDWRASRGMLRAAYRRSDDDGQDGLLAGLYAQDTGAPRLARLLREGSASPQDHGAALEESLIGSLNDLLDVIVGGPDRRFLLDAALSNPDPRSRREIALWLLESPGDAAGQLSSGTPINVLLANPTLDGADAVILERMCELGAETGPGLLGERGLDPTEQLRARATGRQDLDRLVEILADPQTVTG
ncbi:hypothetical protein [Acidipropionibacterium virtanenii]|uniref:Uncharacterized protein n=1 Tax=Acidipropionibacterium virtanenii TaxID=2057246 RepID=A0A344UW64_9ACTN|nr:hypothetical protein [Acidipropionibacterium virtanenii]AXE39512.1 hypothetical protein JS278_02371 [Acidipropionibacterium virtanenii]